MRFFRAQRVQKLIREELSWIIAREVDFPDPHALITVTEVAVDKKMDRATARVSVIPSASAAGALAELEKRTGKLQHLLMKKINIKPMPRISFEIDRGPENAAKVEKALIHE